MTRIDGVAPDWPAVEAFLGDYGTQFGNERSMWALDTSPLHPPAHPG